MDRNLDIATALSSSALTLGPTWALCSHDVSLRLGMGGRRMVSGVFDQLSEQRGFLWVVQTVMNRFALSIVILVSA